MKNTVKTVHHVNLELLRSMGLPMTIDNYSTLNEAFDIPNINPPTVGYPEIKYMSIGRGGHRNVTGTGGSSLVDILIHGVTDATLFEALPFVLVPIAEDLTPAERAKYRIRKLETHNGNEYFAYYLKVIDADAIVPTSRIVTLDDGLVVQDEAYVPVVSSQSPVPVDTSNTIVNTVTGRHIVIQSEIKVDLNANDITRFTDAVAIIYGDTRYATISEIGIVAAYDKEITNNLGGIDATYTEVQTAQVMNFIGTELPLQHNPASASLTYGLSNSMPLHPAGV